MKNSVMTLNFGLVPIRKNFIEGQLLETIELSSEGYAEIRSDYKTNQPFAVIFEDD